MTGAGEILLIACYELGHQPLSVAWPAAFLERAGYHPAVMDLSVEPFDADKVRRAREPGEARLPGAGADRAARAEEIRAPRPRGRAAPRRLRGGQPRLQARLPALPDPARLRPPLLRRPARGGAGRRPPASGRRRRPRDVRRSRFPQRPAPRPRGGPRAARGVSRAHVRFHGEARAPAGPARAPGRAGRPRRPLRRLRGRVARRRRAGAPRPGPHPPRPRGGARGDARGRPVAAAADRREDAALTFDRVRALAAAAAGAPAPAPVGLAPDRRRPPRLSEPWFC